MRYFLDTEFHEEQGKIELISIGIVREDGNEFYAESSDIDLNRVNPWVKDNVVPHLTGARMSLIDIRDTVRMFVGDDKPQFYGWYSDYDWVVFCWLFGAMIDLPKGWPMYCRDLKQTVDMLELQDVHGNIRLPDQLNKTHNALDDARWNLAVFRMLESYSAYPL